jgi:hypothetical protein
VVQYCIHPANIDGRIVWKNGITFKDKEGTTFFLNTNLGTELSDLVQTLSSENVENEETRTTYATIVGDVWWDCWFLFKTWKYYKPHLYRGGQVVIKNLRFSEWKTEGRDEATIRKQYKAYCKYCKREGLEPEETVPSWF